MTNPNSMTGYDAATVAACAKVADEFADSAKVAEARSLQASSVAGTISRREVEMEYAVGYAKSGSMASGIASRIRAMPIAPRAPLVTAEDVALIDAAERDYDLTSGSLWARHYGPRLLALARRAAPAVDATELDRLRERVNSLEAHLAEAVERVEKGDLDERMCCDGHMCGCQGSSKADEFLHFARAALNREGIAG